MSNKHRCNEKMNQHPSDSEFNQEDEKKHRLEKMTKKLKGKKKDFEKKYLRDDEGWN